VKKREKEKSVNGSKKANGRKDKKNIAVARSFSLAGPHFLAIFYSGID